MENYNVVAKSSKEVTFIDGELKNLSVEQIDQKIKECNISFDLQKLTSDVARAEETLASVVNEIDTKVADREALLQKTTETKIAEAKSVLTAEIAAANNKYFETITALKDYSEKVAADLCEYKENGIKAANENLKAAREALANATKTQELLKKYKDLRTLIDQEQQQERQRELAAEQTVLAQATVAHSAPVTQSKLKF